MLKPAFVPTRRHSDEKTSSTTTTTTTLSLSQDEDTRSSVETDETSLSSEVYRDDLLEFVDDTLKKIDDDSSEMTGRIVWTTPKVKNSSTTTTVKETVTATVEVFATKKQSSNAKSNINGEKIGNVVKSKSALEPITTSEATIAIPKGIYTISNSCLQYILLLIFKKKKKQTRSTKWYTLR